MMGTMMERFIKIFDQYTLIISILFLFSVLSKSCNSIGIINLDQNFIMNLVIMAVLHSPNLKVYMISGEKSAQGKR